MASDNLPKRLEEAKRNLTSVTIGPNSNVIRNSSVLMGLFSEAKDLAVRWIDKAQPVLGILEDESLRPLVLFAEDAVRIADRQELRIGEDIPTALRRAILEFKLDLPVLIYGLLEASGVAGLSAEDFPSKRLMALQEIDTAGKQARSDFVNATVEVAAKFEAEVAQATANIRQTVEDAEKDLELVKTKASRISVDSAQKQFKDAAQSLNTKFGVWPLQRFSSF